MASDHELEKERLLGPFRPFFADMAPPTAGPSKAVDSDSDDDFMPALPPSFRNPSNGGPAPAAAPPRPTGPIGPMLPPGFTRSDSPPSPPPPRARAESDDEETGPMPMPAGFGGRGAGPEEENEGVRLMREREERERERERLEKESKAPKREAWMLLPPKEGDLMASASSCFESPMPVVS